MKVFRSSLVLRRAEYFSEAVFLNGLLLERFVWARLRLGSFMCKVLKIIPKWKLSSLKLKDWVSDLLLVSFSS